MGKARYPIDKGVWKEEDSEFFLSHGGLLLPGLIA